MLKGRVVDVRQGPYLMGVVNASMDSFSDAGEQRTLESQLALAERLVEDGAYFIDVGGESARTDRPAKQAAEEIELVCPLIERIAGEVDCVISVDTYKPEVASAAIEAGAELINDISGLRDLRLAEIAASTGAGLVIVHNAGVPKQRLLDQDMYEDVSVEVKRFLKLRMEAATGVGVGQEQLIVDPGPDFSKTPRQTVEVLRSLDELARLGRPLLLAVSRKDFIGALTQRGPKDRLAGTLAAIDFGVEMGANILRVHDVAEVKRFLDARSQLRV